MATVNNCALLQTANGSGTGTGAQTLTIPATTSGSGGYFGLLNQTNNTINRVSTITGPANGTRVGAGQGGSGSSSMELWYLENTSAGSTTLTVTLAANISYRWVWLEFSGVASSSTLGANVANFAASQASSWSLASGSTGATSTNIRLVICLYTMYSTGKGGSNNVPSTYILGTSNGAVEQAIYIGYKIKSSASGGTESATVTGSGASAADIGVVVAAFKLVPNVIQQVYVLSSSSATSITVPVPFAGNTGVLCLEASSGTDAPTQTGNTWTKIADPIGGANCVTGQWYAKNMSGGASGTISFGNTCVSNYSEWYGLSTTAPFDQHVTSSGADSTSTTAIATGTTGTTSNNPQVAIAVVGSQINAKGGTWSSVLNGYSTLGSTTAGGPALIVLYKMLTSNTTTSTGATLNPTVNTNGYGTVLSTFQLPQAAATENPGLMMLGVGPC